MRNRRRQDGEMNGKVPRLCVFTRPAASPPGLLSAPARGLCSRQGCRAGLRSRKKPSAPQLPPDASRPHTCPAGVLGKSCLHCEPVSSCREKTEETRSPRTDPEPYVSQGRPWPPVLPTNYYRVLSPGLLTWASQFSEFANLMISFFFFFKEDLFHLPLVNPCWKLLKSPDNGK